MRRPVALPFHPAPALQAALASSAAAAASSLAPASGRSSVGEFDSRTVYPLEPGAASAERSIFVTRERWTALDVFVSPPSDMPDYAFLRVRVYAIVGQGRTLVASGYVTRMGTPYGRAMAWAAAARVAASHLEVTLTPVGFPSVQAGQTVVTCNASNDAAAAPENVGVALLTGGGVVNLATIIPRADAVPASIAGDLGTELYAIAAQYLGVGVAYLQAVDATTVAGANGLVPRFSLGLDATSGVARIGPEFLTGYRFGTDGCVVGLSTTAATFTAVPAMQQLLNVWGR